MRMFTGRTSYSSPVSSSMMWILCPLGVGQVWISIIGSFLSFAGVVSTFGKSTELARPAGVEPTTPSLEGWCSIQFELRARVRRCRLGGGCRKIWSGWRDLNSRHLAPKASALPDCATPHGLASYARPPGTVNAERAALADEIHLPAFLISGITLPLLECKDRDFGTASQTLPALPGEKGRGVLEPQAT